MKNKYNYNSRCEHTKAIIKERNSTNFFPNFHKLITPFKLMPHLANLKAMLILKTFMIFQVYSTYLKSAIKHLNNVLNWLREFKDGNNSSVII